MKILHLGVYDRNIGDNIALSNLQYSIDKYNSEDVEVIGYNLENLWNQNNSVASVRALYNDVVGKVDLILVGGGGLLEYGGYQEKDSGWKLPFWEETLKFIKIPIYFYGVGVNVFRGGGEYSDKAKKALRDTIHHAHGFAVRNDGSYNKLKNWIGLPEEQLEKVDIVPDPGLLHLDRFGMERKNNVSKLGFQPAINQSKGINDNRFNGSTNLDLLLNKFKDAKTYPHTGKDFRFGKPVITIPEFINKYRVFENLDLYLEKYKEIDYVVAMRGHGQMISMGMNIPGIYLSTQDKVRDFSIENGFEDYNIDMTDDFWEEKLDLSIGRLTEHNSKYLKDWYELRDEFIKKCHEVDEKWIKTNLSKWLV
jgi:polysaccharide pyruvyl transferase WcaK-like protein